MLNECRWMELGAALGDLATDQAAWSQATFGSDAERGPIGALKHLAKEAREAEIACVMNLGIGGDRGIIAEELADCLLLILDAARRSGLTPLQLIRAAQSKMAVNKARTWPKPTSDEPVEHVRGTMPEPDLTRLADDGNPHHEVCNEAPAGPDGEGDGGSGTGEEDADDTEIYEPRTVSHDERTNGI